MSVFTEVLLYVERAIAAAVVICLFVFIYLFDFFVCHMRRFSDKKCDLRLASTVDEERRIFVSSSFLHNSVIRIDLRAKKTLRSSFSLFLTKSTMGILKNFEGDGLDNDQINSIPPIDLLTNVNQIK